MTYYDTLESPVGPLFIAGGDAGLARIEFMDASDALAAHLARFEAATGERASCGGIACDEVLRQLRAYFAGERTTFDLLLAPVGTAWQRDVWLALREIPFGATASYGEIAARLDRPTASRAVGAANARNPLPIVVPCHRVVGADRTLTGYAGGLHRKQWLLAHEGREFGLPLHLDARDARDAGERMALAG